ncbi:MAG: hypothetical protein AAFQ77_01460 [Myxococcota bacterium]
MNSIRSVSSEAVRAINVSANDWENPASLQGLNGTFQSQGRLLGVPNTLNLNVNSENFRVNGTYTGGDGGPQRQFTALPENPAIGFASISLSRGPFPPALLIIEGIQRGADGQINAFRGRGELGQSYEFRRVD